MSTNESAAVRAAALLAENEQLRAALRSEVAKRHHNMDGSALTEDQIDGLVAEALRAVRG